MITKVCDKCDKELEGYTQNHVDYLMRQHQLGSKCNPNNKEAK